MGPMSKQPVRLTFCTIMSAQNVCFTVVSSTKGRIYLEKLRVGKSAGAKGSLEVGGNSWSVGLSTE